MNANPFCGLIDRLIPVPPTAAERAAWARSDLLRHARADHVLRRSPDILAEYQGSPARLSDALDHANDHKRNPAIFAALLLGDDVEAMRLLRNAMTACLQDQAEDAADQEAWTLFDDGISA